MSSQHTSSRHPDDRRSNNTNAGDGESSRPFIRRMLHKYIPSNFNNIVGLTQRLLFEGKAAGRMAMLYSLGALVLTPLDILLQINERRLYRKAGEPRYPQIFVCGAPRSGTTVTAQVLIKHLPVFYFNNLTSLFPRSPVTALKLFGWLAPARNKDLQFDSFYGRTTKLFHPNDALYFWDRWAGKDRKKIPHILSEEAREGMINFFGAMERHSKQPLVNKNNSLNTYAHLVAEAMPNAYFICLDRDPLYLAQSHYRARKFIHGDEGVPYGIRENTTSAEDPIVDICQQVIFHKQKIHEEQDRIGKDRFIILPYEDLCARPAYWVWQLSKKILGHELDLNQLSKELKPFKAANSLKIERGMFEKIEHTLTHMNSNTEGGIENRN